MQFHRTISFVYDAFSKTLFKNTLKRFSFPTVVVSLQSEEVSQVFGSSLCRERKERRRRREKETARLPDWAARDVRS